MNNFSFSLSKWIPFRDKEVIEKVRKIKREDMEAHPNPDFRIKVVDDRMVEHIFISDIFYRIVEAQKEGKKVVFVLPNPSRSYIKLAYLINKFKIECSHVHVFIMDEYADEEGNVAPETWPQGFMHQFKEYFYKNIDKNLRPPEENIKGPTTKNIGYYGKMIEEMGNADACYSGPGWTGHLAFIEPDAPEFDLELKEWRKASSRIVTLSPFTIAQNSLHGSFGMSGDLAAVPPKAATIGPSEVINAKYRMDMHALTVDGTYVSWQRFITRLVLHGPVTPRVPESILQELATDIYVSETIAHDIEPIWNKEY